MKTQEVSGWVWKPLGTVFPTGIFLTFGHFPLTVGWLPLRGAAQPSHFPSELIQSPALNPNCTWPSQLHTRPGPVGMICLSSWEVQQASQTRHVHMEASPTTATLAPNGLGKWHALPTQWSRDRPSILCPGHVHNFWALCGQVSQIWAFLPGSTEFLGENEIAFCLGPTSPTQQPATC